MSGGWDVVIIGAGPAGLAAAIYSGRALLKTLLLEKGIPGGQILITDWVDNYPGFPDGIAPVDLVENLRRQALRFGAAFVTDEAVSLRPDAGGWRVVGSAREYPAKAVLVATGAVHRTLGIPGERELMGRGVSYCAVCDGTFFTGKDIAVVGGGNNALHEALYLTRFCRTLTLIHRRDKFRGEMILQERVLADPKIRVLWNTVPESANGSGRLESLAVRNVVDGSTAVLPVSGLFVSVGTASATDFLKGIVELNEWGQLVTGPGLISSKRGIYAAGDVADVSPKQIVTAVGTGATAALSIIEYLNR
jgi:thioredoxin reductase (NADPH)